MNRQSIPRRQFLQETLAAGAALSMMNPPALAEETKKTQHYIYTNR